MSAHAQAASAAASRFSDRMVLARSYCGYMLKFTVGVPVPLKAVTFPRTYGHAGDVTVVEPNNGFELPKAIVAMTTHPTPGSCVASTLTLAIPPVVTEARNEEDGYCRHENCAPAPVAVTACRR